MRGIARLESEINFAEFVPENYFAPLDFGAVFARTAPIEIDLGCGDGSFLAQLAQNYPDRNFLGIERLLGRVRSSSRKITARGLANARVLRVELSYAVNYLLPPVSVAGVHIMFPDPWPKRRHQRRRIVNADFLAAISHAVIDRGFVRVVTDQLDYFEEITRAASAFSCFTPDESAGLTSYPPSAFEKHFRAAGAPIHHLVLRKISGRK